MLFDDHPASLKKIEIFIMGKKVEVPVSFRSADDVLSNGNIKAVRLKESERQNG